VSLESLAAAQPSALTRNLHSACSLNPTTRAYCQIVPATQADLAAIAACEAPATAINAIGSTRRDTSQDGELAKQVSKGMIHLAADASKVLGYISFSPIADHLFVASLAVTSQFRRMGLGRRLLGFAERTARDLALPTVRLFTDGLEGRNLLFYRQCGYVEAGRCEDRDFRRVFFCKVV
jgi:ribosomal protein S18 acetylase RimI-like enzyme